MVTEITWTSEQRKLGELIPWPRNPRQITKEQARRLSESLDEFGQVQTIAISPENQILDGHQRQLVWAASEKFGPDLEVDVRVASRALTEKEREKLAVYLHKGAAGEWDFDVLANEFELDELLEWGFTEWDFGIDRVEPEDYSELDEELASLGGYEEENVTITVPAMHKETVIEWLANGEVATSPGMGKGVLRRCGLL